MIHTVKGFNIVNGAEVDAFLEFPCFLYDARDIDNLISGSSAFFKSSLRLGRVDVATSLHFLPEASSCWRLLSRDMS